MPTRQSTGILQEYRSPLDMPTQYTLAPEQCAGPSAHARDVFDDSEVSSSPSCGSRLRSHSTSVATVTVAVVIMMTFISAFV